MIKFIFYGIAVLVGLGLLAMAGFYLFMNVALHSEVKLFFTDRYTVPEYSPIEQVKESAIEARDLAIDRVIDPYRPVYYLDSAGNILPDTITYEEKLEHHPAFLLPQDSTKGILFAENKVYRYTNWSVTNAEHTFVDLPITSIVRVIPISDTSVALLTEYNESPYAHRATHQVWLCHLSDYTTILIQDQSSRLMMDRKYELPEIASTVLVTFQGDLAWGFGGDVYRPKYNNLHFFSERYPDGVHLFQSSFKAGLVKHIQYDSTSNSIVVYSDPTRPVASAEEREKAKVCQFNLVLPSVVAKKSADQGRSFSPGSYL